MAGNLPTVTDNTDTKIQTQVGQTPRQYLHLSGQSLELTKQQWHYKKS